MSEVFSDNVFFGEEQEVPEILKNILRTWSMDINCVIPAVVLGYDRLNNIVEVLPALNQMLGGEDIDIPIPRSPFQVPCFNPYGGIVGINFPLLPGNTGWVIGCDRDATFFKQLLTVTNPATYNVHKYEFGFFVPDKIKGFIINENELDALTIQTLDGTTRIAIANGKVKIISADKIVLESLGNTSITTTGDTSITASGKTTVNSTGKISVTGNSTTTVNSTGAVNVTTSSTATLTASGAVNIKGSGIKIDGALTVTGAATFNSSVTAVGDVIAGSSISLLGHKHKDSTPGVGTTGTPV